jgi:hypothetical protein
MHITSVQFKTNDLITIDLSLLIIVCSAMHLKFIILLYYVRSQGCRGCCLAFRQFLLLPLLLPLLLCSHGLVGDDDNTDDNAGDGDDDEDVRCVVCVWVCSNPSPRFSLLYVVLVMWCIWCSLPMLVMWSC